MFLTVFRFLLQIASNNLWHPRRSILEYLQVMIFANLFAIASNAKFVSDVKELVLSLLADEQLEVSEFWCNSGAFSVSSERLQLFVISSKTEKLIGSLKRILRKRFVFGV